MQQPGIEGTHNKANNGNTTDSNLQGPPSDKPLDTNESTNTTGSLNVQRSLFGGSTFEPSTTLLFGGNNAKASLNTPNLLSGSNKQSLLNEPFSMDSIIKKPSNGPDTSEDFLRLMRSVNSNGPATQSLLKNEPNSSIVNQTNLAPKEIDPGKLPPIDLSSNFSGIPIYNNTAFGGLEPKPIFSALNPTTKPNTANVAPKNNPPDMVVKNETQKANHFSGTSSSALGFLGNITSGTKTDGDGPMVVNNSSALGKLSSLRNSSVTTGDSLFSIGLQQNPSLKSSTQSATPYTPISTGLQQNSFLTTRTPPPVANTVDPTHTFSTFQEALPNGPFVPPNDYLGLTTNKPIIDSSNEFNYKLPDYLSQPNSAYVQNYVVPQLGSVEAITRQLAAAHIENKSQLDTLDSLSSNIIDLVQNKNLYYGSGQFSDMNLKTELIQGLFEMGYRIPSRIQEATLPIIVNQKKNLVAQSQNGTGKTGAFALALLSNLDPKTNYPEAVVVAPTYELASQIKSVIDKMAKHMPGMSTILGIKGNRLTVGTKITDKIVIGTPGTVADWMTKLKFFDPRNIKMFVLDEADVMISQTGHLTMCSRIKSCLPKNCQSLLFSATYPASVCSFANFSVPNATVIRVKSSELTLDSVKQYYTYVSNQDEQFDFAWNLFTTICIAQCIIFCDTRSAAKQLAIKFTSCGFKTSVISGEQSVEERAAVIERLRKGKDKVLIATNVVARGIDISTTSLIINFDIPVEYNHNRQSNNTVPDFETYLHRVGRAGRFGVKGICVTVAKSMKDIELLGKIQAYFNHEIKPIHPWNAEQLNKLDPIKNAMEAESR